MVGTGLALFLLMMLFLLGLSVEIESDCGGKDGHHLLRDGASRGNDDEQCGKRNGNNGFYSKQLYRYGKA